MSLAKNIVKARKRVKMSQADLARKLKKSRSSVNEYEAGTHEPPIEVLRKIARVTGAELAELLA